LNTTQHLPTSNWYLPISNYWLSSSPYLVELDVEVFQSLVAVNYLLVEVSELPSSAFY
jgi:hypothetical protein